MMLLPILFPLLMGAQTPRPSVERTNVLGDKLRAAIASRAHAEADCSRRYEMRLRTISERFAIVGMTDLRNPVG